jgi:2-amino-1-hydroxyethylphosphonate dioxygenase (glycine-forming)
METAESVIDEIFHLYEQHGNDDYIGEPVSQLEHMSQAAQMAMAEGYDDEVILAAFFHDLGHLCVHRDEANSMNGFGIRDHESAGAAYLRMRNFPERMVRLIENHVKAKRYLTSVDPKYLERLSDASKETLRQQGGPMSRDEAREFEADPLFALSITLRRWDEAAKKTKVPILDLTILKQKAKNILSQAQHP